MGTLLAIRAGGGPSSHASPCPVASLDGTVFFFSFAWGGAITHPDRRRPVISKGEVKVPNPAPIQLLLTAMVA